jgi:uncharacterized protein YjbJ (UPF0337 family)
VAEPSSRSVIYIASRHRHPGGAISRDGASAMNEDIIQGNWNQLKGKIQQQWGKLTGDDLDMIEGKRKELVGRVQERYGYARDEAEKEVNRFLDSMH